MPPSHTSATRDADVLIVGAGPVGLALACALDDFGLSVTVLEQQGREGIESPPEDGREIALTHRARRIMEDLGLWRHLATSDVSDLREAKVLDGGSPAVLNLASGSRTEGGLGWLVPNYRIRSAAWNAASQRPGVRVHFDARVAALELAPDAATVTLADGSKLRATLVVAADSRFSQTRRMAGIGASMHDFGRGVVLCRVHHEGGNEAVAWECFHYGNTLALLPLGDHLSSAVVTVAADRIPHWLALPDEEFAARIAAQAPRHFGAVSTAGPRHHYPLVGVYAHRFAARRLALIGDAAVGMHPVTAHGWNFGLYGIEALARQLETAHAKSTDIGAPGPLQAFESEHRRVTLPIYLGTNAIVTLFTDDRALPKLARQAVLAVAEHLPPFSGLIKSAITRQLTADRRLLSRGA